MKRYIVTKNGILHRDVKAVNRNGKPFYRDAMGQEYPAYMVRETLNATQQAQYDQQMSYIASERKAAQRIIHPEDY